MDTETESFKELADYMEKLLQIQDAIDKFNGYRVDEVLKIDHKRKEDCKELCAKRNEITKSIPYFWNVAFKGHPVLSSFVKFEDNEMFKHLTFLEVVERLGVNSGYALIFTFEPNPYFEDTTLIKTYTFLDDGRTEITATPIKWKTGKEPRVQSMKPYYQSFFDWLSSVKWEEMADDQEDMIADNITEDLWLNPLSYFKTETDWREIYDEVTTNGKEENKQNNDGVLQSLLEVLRIQDEIEKINEKASDKVLEVEKLHNLMCKYPYEMRNNIIGNIPDFWLTALLSHPVLTTFIRVDDEKIFKYLASLEVEGFRDVNSGYSITFYFKPNPYFEETKLTKTFKFLAEGTTEVTTTTIKWKEGKVPKLLPNLEFNLKPLSPWSFFSWFLLIEASIEDLKDEVADAIVEDLWPNPLRYFTAEPDVSRKRKERSNSPISILLGV